MPERTFLRQVFDTAALLKMARVSVTPGARAQLDSTTVAQTSKSAVSQVSKPAGAFDTRPTWKSAIQQVWKPALRRFRLLRDLVVLSNNGIVSPGASPGKLIVGGSYTQTTNGSLNIELAGTAPGTNFDLLIVTNNAALAGTLNVTLTNGFYPGTNATFTFLTTASRSGTFGNFNYPSNLVGLQLNYAATSAAVQVINVHPVISPVPNQNIPEMQTFTLAAMATDDDRPAQTLHWSVPLGPAGLMIDTDTGVINWTPDQTQSPSTNAGDRFYRARLQP